VQSSFRIGAIVCGREEENTSQLIGDLRECHQVKRPLFFPRIFYVKGLSDRHQKPDTSSLIGLAVIPAAEMVSPDEHKRFDFSEASGK
jgi:hypothetical protein